MLFFHKEPENLEEGLRRAQQTKGAVLLDVRTPEEYSGGHLPGSVNLPLDELSRIDYEKETPLFVYCRSGARSGRAVKELQKMGYRQSVNIGGVLGYHGVLER